MRRVFQKKKAAVRRPESENDRRQVLKELSAAHAKGEIDDHQFEKLRERAKNMMTQVQCKQITQSVATGASIVAALATVVAVPAAASGNENDQDQNDQDLNEEGRNDFSQERNAADYPDEAENDDCDDGEDEFNYDDYNYDDDGVGDVDFD